jgi:aldose 1-epimerase
MKRLLFYPAMIGMLCLTLLSCGSNDTKKTDVANDTAATRQGVTQASWGQADGKAVNLYTLTNKNGVQVKITNYGGIVTSWMVPDKNDKQSSIVIGFDSLQGYLQKPPYFGALIGRYGNRIGNARFTLDGQTYTLAANDGKNHLHGGNKGYDKVVWDATFSDSTPALTLNYLSKDGEEGYPGNLKVSVIYTLTDDNELLIDYNAETDKATPVNLTNHCYFNLTGDVKNSILNHTLQIDADNYTPVDATLIPTGEIKSVKGTPFDFTKAEKIGARIGQVQGGYDHNYVLNRKDSTSMQLVATLADSISGRKMEVYTVEPGLQFYSGNFLDGTFRQTDGTSINKHTALCLETQHYPDSPNKPKFPSTILRPGQKYHTVTKYKVSVEK